MKYWVYMNGEVPGSYTPEELGKLSGFSMTTLVCPAEGEILEKNWRRSGEYPDIIEILHQRDADSPPSAPAQAQEAVMTGDVNKLIDTASTRLFSHVSELMKELEHRREERSLLGSVQRQLVDMKDQLQQAREKCSMLESRVPRIAELEESARKDQAQIQSLEGALKAREEGMSELRQQLARIKSDLEGSKRRLGEAMNDLSIRNRLVDKLSRDLTEKELSLAKSLGVIRRLEEDLNRIYPIPESPKSSEGKGEPKKETKAPPQPARLPPRPATRRPLPSERPSVPPPPPADAPTDQPAAQGALVDLFKKFMPKNDA